MKHRCAVLAMLLAASAGARADAEHDRIAAEREAAQAALADRERHCNEQFVVSGCLAEARSAHRATLNRLRREELTLDETGRRAAGDVRRKDIAAKAATGQAHAADATDASSETRIHPVPRAAAIPAFRPPGSGRPRPAGQPASGVSRAEQERRNTEAYEARAEAAEAHRAAIARRNAERVQKGPDAAPLPVSPTASSSR